ncbi:unnamed protein product [Clonostachys rosea]|uniref:UFSP1/2/DUB catalytic domain-containing protein n=1 Tax=Bionectria ochroleuca TaxID=29856 RepID=A0ABY6TT78_BIOOC|nr:unnamed protein product [Clonostachys rosea]
MAGDENLCPYCGCAERGIDELMMHIDTAHPDDPSGTAAAPEAAEREGSSSAPRRESRRKGERSRHHHHRGHSAAEGSSSRKRTTPTKKTAPSSQPRIVQAWREIFGGKKTSRTHEARKPRSSPRSRTESSGGSQLKQTRSKASGSQGQENDDSVRSVKDITKLGRSDLGRHHNESHMPEWLVSILERNEGVCKEGIVPVVQQLLDQCDTTEYAYVCSPCVTHISKTRREGSFCGYRNIQMLTSWIIASGAQGSNMFGPKFPSIFQIQDLIENAWDNGFNAQGRVETGGIRGTRKYIGTSEVKPQENRSQESTADRNADYCQAHAMFSSLGILCPPQAFKDKDFTVSRNLLYAAIERYFQQGLLEEDSKVHATVLPPIYFQHRGHSMTIIGFEKQTNGKSNLLVFDPGYRDPSVVSNLVGKPFRHPPAKASAVLESYRRGNKYLRRFGEFEILWYARINTLEILST